MKKYQITDDIDFSKESSFIVEDSRGCDFLTIGITVKFIGWDLSKRCESMGIDYGKTEGWLKRMELEGGYRTEKEQSESSEVVSFYYENDLIARIECGDKSLIFQKINS